MFPAGAVQLHDRFAVKWRRWPLDDQWITLRGVKGDLALLPAGHERASLPADVATALAAAEIRLPRVLAAPTVFLFAAEAVAGLGDIPGVDDPVAVVGRMSGPFPVDGSAAAPFSAPGRLCLARAEVLDALARAEPFALHSGDSASSHHATVCGDMESPERASSLVILYPLHRDAPPCPMDSGPATAALLYDVLAALREDLRAHGIEAALGRGPLPVPSRADLEAGLRRAGWEIERDLAYPPAPPDASWLSRLRRGLWRRAEELPPQGTLAGFLEIARAAVEAIPGGPGPRVRAARRAGQVLQVEWPGAGPDALRPVALGGARAPEASADGLTLPPAATATGGNLVFRVPPTLYLEGERAPVEIEAELRDVPYGGQVCHVPAWAKEYAVHASYDLGGSLGWTTRTWSLPESRLDGALWGGDFGLYCHDARATGEPFRVRRLAVRVVRPGGFAPTDAAARGGLDFLGAPGGTNLLEGGGRLARVSAASGVLSFSGWILDLARGTASGEVAIVLRRAGRADVIVPASSRHERRDLVNTFGGGHSGAGYAGTLDARGIAPGLYRLHVRLRGPDGASAETDSGAHLDVTPAEV